MTRRDVADRLSAYLNHDVSLCMLVDWAESAMMEAEFDEEDLDTIRSVIARLGLADVRAFGLTWDDCEDMLRELGFAVHLTIEAV